MPAARLRLVFAVIPAKPGFGTVDGATGMSEWLALGSGEIATMALVLENQNKIVLLDDTLCPMNC
jgi:hypothetical protein